MKEDIEVELSELVGLPLTFTRRIGSMQCFEFGEQLPSTNRRGEPITLADRVLHVQCPWRIFANGRILVGSSDLYVPGDDGVDMAEISRLEPGASLRDRTMAAIRSSLPSPDYTVTMLESDAAGGLHITFENGYELELFLAGSSEDEEWRLMRKGPHFVVSGTGVEPPVEDESDRSD